VITARKCRVKLLREKHSLWNRVLTTSEFAEIVPPDAAILDAMMPNFPAARRWLDWLLAGASVLVLFLCLLLFVQWPLREWIQLFSRQANDIGQILFSLYAAVAITSASIAGSHLAIARNHGSATSGKGDWSKWAVLLCVGPWSIFLIWTAVPQMLVSVAQLESFSEGNTPGYFILRIALVLLGVLVLVEAVNRVFPRTPPPEADVS